MNSKNEKQTVQTVPVSKTNLEFAGMVALITGGTPEEEAARILARRRSG